MASFTSVGDNTELQMVEKGENVDIAISGTYNMTIAFQREVGSPGSGSWETLKTYTTANATVADTHITQKHDEKLRLIVQVDTSGTATATLTDGLDKTVTDYKTLGGVSVMETRQSGLYLKKSLSGPPPVTLTASDTITEAEHAGRVINLSAAAGLTVTLPAATGTGNIYRFFVLTTVTSNNYIIQVANATDVIQGVITVATDTSGITVPTAATSDTITMNGTTTGGVIGGYLILQDVSSGFFSITGGLNATGVEATPFSAAVS